MTKIQDVPHVFRMPDVNPYPSGNFPDFELFFAQKVTDSEIEDGWVYLPILWTAYLKRANFGNDKQMVQVLQDYINGLDKTAKYFTIVQYDDGPLVDLSGINVKVFSMSGKPSDYELPLICQKAPYNFYGKKDIFCSFIGRATHPIRDAIFNSDIIASQGCYISTGYHSPEQYHKILSRSVFSLCPRGYGPTSFRVQESITMGAIPVYVSNRFHIPHNGDFDYGVIIGEKDIADIFPILRGIPAEEIKRKQSLLPTVYASQYAFGANKNIILNQLKKW